MSNAPRTSAPNADAAPSGSGADAVPEGFRPIAMGGPFMSFNGPLYGRLDGERVRLGFRVEKRHCNPMDNCHGGMLASFADMVLPVAAMYGGQGERRFLPTISLQMDYLAPVPLGAWVEGEGQILRETRNMVFLQGLVHADGVPVLRASGVFKQGPLIGDGTDRDPFRLRNPAPPANS